MMRCDRGEDWGGISSDYVIRPEAKRVPFYAAVIESPN